MLQIEHQFEEFLGEFMVQLTGLLGFSRLKAGDKYEVALRYGKGQKWKSHGQIVKKGYQLDQLWSATETQFRPLIGESIAIRVTEGGGKLGKGKVVGFAQCETKDLFVSEKQELAIDLNEMGSLKLAFTVQWKPFKGEDLPMPSGATMNDMTAPPPSQYSGLPDSSQLPLRDPAMDNVSVLFLVA